MSFVGKMARGLAAGLGTYYNQKAATQEEERRSQILLDRQMALARFTQGLQNEAADGQLGRAKDLATHNSALNRGEKALEISAKTTAEKAKEDRENSEWSRRQQVEFNNDMKKLEKEQGFEMNKMERQSALEIARDAAKEGLGIDHWETDLDTGTLIGVSSKSGRIFRSDVKPTPKTAPDPFGFNSGPSNRPDVRAQAQKPTAAPQILTGTEEQIAAQVAKLPKGAIFVVDGEKFRK